MGMYVSEICAEGIFVTFPWWLKMYLFIYFAFLLHNMSKELLNILLPVSQLLPVTPYGLIFFL